MHIWQFVCIVDMFFLLSVEQTGRNSQMNAVNVNKRCRKHDSNHNQRIVVVRINFHTTWRRVIHPKEVKKNVYDCIYLYRKQKTINRQTMASDNFIRIKMRSSVYAISFTIETIKHWHIITSWQKKKRIWTQKKSDVNTVYVSVNIQTDSLPPERNDLEPGKKRQHFSTPSNCPFQPFANLVSFEYDKL